METNKSELDVPLELNCLFAVRAELASIELKWSEKRKEAVPADVRDLLTQLDKERAQDLAQLQAKQAELEQRIKQHVLATGEVGHGECLGVSLCLGKKSWDSKILEKLAKTHEIILTAQKTGEPYAIISTLQAKA